MTTTFKPEVARDFINKLSKVRWAGDSKATACCPAHPDKSPSLSIRIEADKLLTFCHAMQCSHEAILAAVGYKVRDFYDHDGEAARRWAHAGPPVPPLRPIDPVKLEKLVLQISRNKLKQGQTLSLEDQARLELAIERLREVE
ncbi:MAG: hypothetical protein HQL47_05435 [Gammaproteobacteria bacterium]|nr:hypothetical protein [Gammaproteobacteria bacterium]